MLDSVVQIDAENKAQLNTYADLLVNYLAQIGVEYIFGVPGGAIEPLYDALARHMRISPDNLVRGLSTNSMIPVRQRSARSHIRSVIARHEAGAAFMADGYARETGRLGVCCATTGPGSTNLITGVAAAYADRVPMLVITPQTALPDFGKQGLQESSSDAVDIVGMFEHCTQYNSLVSHPSQLEGKLYTALLNAFRRPRGPVHLSIPMDILKTKVEKGHAGYQVAHLFRQPKTMDEEAYQALFKAISTTKNIVLFIGGGCRRAVDIIIAYAEHTHTPIVTTPTGKSCVNSYHPLYRGVFGFAGHESAYETIMDEEVDLILAVGTSLGELSTCGWDKGLMSEKLVHIAGTAEDFARSPMACLHVFGDPEVIFGALYRDFLINSNGNDSETDVGHENEKLSSESAYFPASIKTQEEEKCFSDASPLKPQRVMREFAERFPEKTRFVVDAGNAWAWAIHYLFLNNTGTFRAGFGFGAMTWGIGAAIGTAMGNRDHPVVCITGDGCYLMSGQEITTAVEQQLPVIFVVLNDQALGMVKHGQRLGGAEPIGFELPAVDFARVARAMGAQGYTIRTTKDFERLDIDKICSSNVPTLLDIYIDPEEIPPLGVRINTLNRKTEHGVRYSNKQKKRL